MEGIIPEKYNLTTVLGPTASGKTSFAAHLAKLQNAEIISADSRQVYKNMDIGTGKDLEDYIVNGEKIDYHLIDIIEAGKKYNLFKFQKDFFDSFKKIKNRNKNVLMCGGTGLYLDAIIRNYELLEVPPNNKLRKELEKKELNELTEILSNHKKLHNKTDIDTKKRAIRAIEIEIYKKEHNYKKNNFPKIDSFNIGIKFDRKTQKKRISERLKQRIKNGMIEEVKKLIDKGVSSDTLIYYGLEYKYVTLYLLKKLNFDEFFKRLEISIHQFSKRQMTWFRRMEKKGVKIWWLDGFMSFDEKIKRIKEIVKKEAV